MARATAELGATYFSTVRAMWISIAMNCARARIKFMTTCTCTAGESIIGREVAMIGFGRIGRALVDLTARIRSAVAGVRPICFQRPSPANIRCVGGPPGTCLTQANCWCSPPPLPMKLAESSIARDLARLPDGATIINIARGGLIDLDALTTRSATWPFALCARCDRPSRTVAHPPPPATLSRGDRHSSHGGQQSPSAARHGRGRHGRSGKLFPRARR